MGPRSKGLDVKGDCKVPSFIKNSASQVVAFFSKEKSNFEISPRKEKIAITRYFLVGLPATSKVEEEEVAYLSQVWSYYFVIIF